ncbi:MAG: hypothetical protein ABSC60_13495, partial [Acidobacteriota bacterium]
GSRTTTSDKANMSTSGLKPSYRCMLLAASPGPWLSHLVNSSGFIRKLHAKFSAVRETVAVHVLAASRIGDRNPNFSETAFFLSSEICRALDS